MKKITLSKWNNEYFARPRTPRTLYQYVKDGKIFPAPVKVGREYEVEPTAILIDNECITDTNSLMERINGQKTEARKRGVAA